MAEYSNFSYGTVLTAPTPAASGTSLVLNSGEGTNFKTGWVWIWPPSVQPLSSNAEIAQLTNISTDTLTIVRAQQGTSAKSIAVGWQVAQGLTKQDVHNILNKINYAADAGASDSYAITLEPAPTAYTTGQVVTFKANTANTGAATLNVNSLGAKTIKKNVNEDTATGDIIANQLVTVVYDGTNFQMINPVAGLYSGPISFTPSWTNLTIGNGTQAGYYTQVGKWVEFYISLTFGSTTSISGAVAVAYPVGSAATTFGQLRMPVGMVTLEDNGTNNFVGIVRANAAAPTVRMDIMAQGSASTYVDNTGVTSTIPFTWTTNDQMMIHGRYEIA
jgi:hypothetical protein